MVINKEEITLELTYMKRAFLSMVCMVSLVMMTACGGGGNAKKDGSEGTAFAPAG